MADEMMATSERREAMVETHSAREIQEVQAAMIIAKRFPRNERQAVDRILNACSRPALAERALYQYSRGGMDITGPSIRMAETMAQAWGNMQYGVRELEQRDGESTVEAFCWDLETNTRAVRVFQVRHEIEKKGNVKKKLTDPRDIYELVANQGARRLRACILEQIPIDITESAVAQIDTTNKAKCDITPEKIKSMLEKFSDFGVTKEQLEKKIQRRIDGITPALMVSLGKIYNSLKDGMSKPADWFEAVAPSAVFSAVSGQQEAAQ